MKLLVLTPEPIDAAALRSVAGGAVEDAEVMIVTPATEGSALRFWMTDVDEAIGSARAAAEESVERLEEEDIDAVGDAGESEPIVALQDALATFPADRVVIFTHPGGDRDYREDAELSRVEERFGVKVDFAEISRELG